MASTHSQSSVAISILIVLLSWSQSASLVHAVGCYKFSRAGGLCAVKLPPAGIADWRESNATFSRLAGIVDPRACAMKCAARGSTKCSVFQLLPPMTSIDSTIVETSTCLLGSACDLAANWQWNSRAECLTKLLDTRPACNETAATTATTATSTVTSTPTTTPSTTTAIPTTTTTTPSTTTTTPSTTTTNTTTTTVTTTTPTTISTTTRLSKTTSTSIPPNVFSVPNSGANSQSGFVQLFDVDTTGCYKLAAYGARGGTAGSYTTAGNGAYIAGHFLLNAGQKLAIVVGKPGQSSYGGGNDAGGGGGGTFVWLAAASNRTLLVAAGGGGGSGSSSSCLGYDGSAEKSGVGGGGGAGGAGGVDGAGGSAKQSGSGNGGGGGGWLTAGEDASGNKRGRGGETSSANWTGGNGDSSYGGYGGGGGGGGGGKTAGGGGGGGYSGGGGGDGNCGGGGGGGSYWASSAANIERIAGGNSELNGKAFVQLVGPSTPSGCAL